jgi:hypothetical protein
MRFPKVAAPFASLTLALSPAAAQIGPPPGGGSSGVSSIATSCPSSGPTTGAASLAGTLGIDAQTGTTYTVTSTDCGELLTLNNAAAVALSLPVAGTTGFPSGFYVAAVQNLGAGVASIAPSSCSTSNLLNGVCTAITLAKGQSLGLATDDANWFAQAGLGSSGGGTPFPLAISGTVTSGGIPYFSSVTQMTTSAVLAANSLMVGGGAGGAPSTVTTGAGVLTALGNAVNSTSGFPVIGGSITNGDCLKWSATGIQDAGAACGGGSSASLANGSSTITGGAAGRVLTDTGGTLGEAALSGTGTSVVSTTGTQTSGDCVEIDPNGNHVDAGAACGSGGGVAPVGGHSLFYPMHPGAITQATGAALSVTLAYCNPFVVSTSQHWNEIASWAQTAGTSNVEFAVYSDAVDLTTHRHQPQTVYSSLTSGPIGNTSTAATIAWTFTSTPFPAGMYWICTAANDTTFKSMSLASSNTLLAGMMGSTSAQNIIGGASHAPVQTLTAAHTFGTWGSFAGVTMAEPNSSPTSPVYAVGVSSVP